VERTRLRRVAHLESIDENDMTLLSKRQFRLLLVAYCIFNVLGFMIVRGSPHGLTPELVHQAKANFHLVNWADADFALFMIWFLGTLIVAWLIGLIFTFLCWREGLYIFAFAVCARVIWELFLVPRHGSLLRGYWLGWLALSFEAFIFVVALFGPAKHLFARK